MATFYLINAVTLGTTIVQPGSLVAEGVQDTASIIAAGGLLWPSSDPIIAAAAVHALNVHLRGGSLQDQEAVMQSAVQAAQLAATSPSLGQTQWDINFLSGDDRASGVAGSGFPIKTLAGWCRRNRVFNPAGHIINVVGGDMPSTDNFSPSGLLEPGSGNNTSIVTLIGQEKVLFSSTATSNATRSNYEGGTNLQATFTDTTLVVASFIGKQIVIDSGPAINAKAQILADLGGGVARITDFHSDAGGFVAAPLSGVSYHVADYTNFAGVFNMRGAPIGAQILVSKMAWILGSFAFLTGGASTFTDCRFDRVPNFPNTFTGGAAGFIRCMRNYLTLRDDSLFTPVSSFEMACGYKNARLRAQGPSRRTFQGCATTASTLSVTNVDTEIGAQSCQVFGIGAAAARGGLGVWAPPAGFNAITVARGGKLLSAGISTLGGSGATLVGLKVREGGKYFSQTQGVTANGLTGTAGDLQLETAAVAMPALEASAGAILPATSALATWADLAAAPFLGNAMSYKTGAAFVETNTTT